MGRTSNADREAQVWQDAKRQFNEIQSTLYNERKQCLEDRRFYQIAGAQWEGRLGEQFKNRPQLEINKILLAVIKIFNEYRSNRISVSFIPKDGQENNLSDSCNGLYRADEQDSCAEEAYDNAYEEAVSGGFGAYRLRADDEDEESEDDTRQRIRIEPIFDADNTVFFDLNAKRQDKSDARYCFVLTAYSPDAYKDEWGDDPATWEHGITKGEFDWATPDCVWVAEYYKVEQKSETVYFYGGLDGSERKVRESEFDEDEDLEQTLQSTGYRLMRQKDVKRQRVHKYILSGGGILKDHGYIAGKWIPIVACYGKRSYVDNIERCSGHVRVCKDAQRLKNLMMSQLAYMVSKSPIEKPIFVGGQMNSYKQMWADDDIEDYPYLLVDETYDANGQPIATGPVAYTKAPSIPPALAALHQAAEQDIQDLLGNQEAGEQIQPSASGVAVELVQNRLDMQAFIYIDNMKKSIQWGAKVWLSMASEVYVEEGRKMKTVDSQDTAGSITLREKKVNPDTDAVVEENNLAKASFDVVSSVGPLSASRRAAVVRELTSLIPLTQDPETVSVLTAMTMMNMEGEGIQDVRDYFRGKLLRMGVVKPTEEEKLELQQEQANAQPSANDQYLQAAAAEAAAKGDKAKADTVLTMAKVQETAANTQKIYSEIGASKDDNSSNPAI